MTWRKLTWTALCLPVLATGSVRADDDKPAASDTPKAEAPADKPAADTKAADETPPPARPGGLLRRNPRQPGAARPAGQALRSGIGAALRAVEGLEGDGPLPPPGGPDGAGPPAGPDAPRRPLPPPDPRYGPPGGFEPGDGPPLGDDDRGLPPPRRPSEDGPPPPDDGVIGPPPDGPRPPRSGGGLRGAAPRPAAAPLPPIGPDPFAPGGPPAGGPHIAPPAGSHPPITGQYQSAGPPDPELQRLNKQEAELDHEARDLSARFRQTSDEGERGKLREKLADVVTRHFEVRQKRRQFELERLEKQLDRLRGSLDKRTAAREALIKQRTDQLLGEEADAGF